jgi:hypothetical protein
VRKGSLSLSINAIVVLILAVTLLSLGLTFINKTFGGATGALQKSLTGIDEDRKAQLMSKCQDSACLESSKMTIKRNNLDENLLVLNNRLDCEVDVSIDIGNGGTECNVLGSGDTSCEDITFLTFESQPVLAKEKVIVPIQVKPQNSATSTTYRYKVDISGECEGSNIQKTLYLDIEVE